MTSRTAHWQAARLLQAEETHIRSKHTSRNYRIQTAAIGSPPPSATRPRKAIPSSISSTATPSFPPPSAWRNPCSSTP